MGGCGLADAHNHPIPDGYHLFTDVQRWRCFGPCTLKYFYVLVIFAGLINVIPVVGPILVAGTVAAISSLSKLVVLVIFFIVYHNVANVFLTPRIMQAKLQIPAATVIAALIVGDVLAGFIGMLLAVPTAVLIAAFIDEYVVSHAPAVPETVIDGHMRRAG